jgi:predicted signal transduction protein with EAL and GGDEF domain
MSPGHRRELEDMLATADSALYQAKQAGRNRVSAARYPIDTELRMGFRGDTVQTLPEPVEADPAGASLGPATLR